MAKQTPATDVVEHPGLLLLAFAFQIDETGVQHIHAGATAGRMRPSRRFQDLTLQRTLERARGGADEPDRSGRNPRRPDGRAPLSAEPV